MHRRVGATEGCRSWGRPRGGLILESGSSFFSPLLEPLSLYQPRHRPAIGPVLPGGHPRKMCAGLFSLGGARGARSPPRGAAPWLHWTTGCLNSEDLTHPHQGQAPSLREAAVEKGFSYFLVVSKEKLWCFLCEKRNMSVRGGPRLCTRVVQQFHFQTGVDVLVLLAV